MAQPIEVVPFFENKPRLNKAASEKAGREVYDDRIVCTIRIPGDAGRVVTHPITHGRWVTDPGTRVRRFETITERFPKQYAQFLAGQQQSQAGTPISVLPGVTAAKVAELKHLSVYTVEQLAGLEGNQLKALGMFGRDLKTKAQAYLDNAAGAANANEQAEQIASLTQQVAALQAQIAAGGTPAPTDEPKSPFEEYDDADIQAWLDDAIKANGLDMRVDKRWSRATLIQKADEVNNSLKKKAA